MKAVHEGGGLGFIAAGYKSSEAMTAEIAATRELNIPFGMNVFVPDPSQLPPGPEARAELEAYRAELEPEAARYGVTLPPSGSMTTTPGRTRSMPCWPTPPWSS